jgi:hypothetical protein
VNTYMPGAGVGGAALAATGLGTTSELMLYTGLLLMAGACAMIGVSGRRRRQDRAATRR